MSTFRTAALHAGVAVLVAIASLPVADGVFRLLGDTPSDDLRGLFETFRGDTYKLRPAVRTSESSLNGVMDVFTDALGLRVGVDTSRWSAAGDTLDYLFIGDSQGFGNLLNYERTIPGQFVAMDSAHQLRVGNASTGGHTLRNQLAVLQWLVDEQRVRPRHVVLLATPLMLLQADGVNRPQVTADGRLTFGNPSLKARSIDWLRTRTTLFARLRGALRAVVLGNPRLARALGIGDAGDPAALAIYRTDVDTDTREQAIRAALTELDSLAGAAGAALTVVYLPPAHEHGFEPIRTLARQRGASVDSAAQWVRLSRVAAELDLATVDVSPALEAVAKAGAPLTMRRDPHYSAEVSRESALLLWQSLGPELPPRGPVRAP